MLQGMIKSQDEVKAIATSSLLSYLIREMVELDPGIAIALPQLKVQRGRATEVLKSWDVISQDYANNEDGNDFIYLSTTEVVIRTEIITA